MKRTGFLLLLSALVGYSTGPSSPLAAQAQKAATPTNNLPNPYKTIENWAKMPAGRTWGATSAVDIDKDGTSVWVAERCGANSCAGSDLPPMLHFDRTGNLRHAFGQGLLLSPHGIHVDRDGNIWVTDCACTTGGRGGAAAPAETGKGHQVFKFSPEGKVLMTLGKAGGAREPDFFWQPNDVVVAADGSIFVAEGHSSSAGSNARVLKFSKDGRLIRSFGSLGAGPDQFDQPHTLAIDSRGRLFVGDRNNNRIQIFDLDFKLLDTWYQFSRPSGIYIDKNDVMYVSDSESNTPRKHGEWKRGIRIGSAKDGRVTAFIPDPEPSPDSGPGQATSAAEGVAADANGVIYGAEVGPRALKRYVKSGT